MWKLQKPTNVLILLILYFVVTTTLLKTARALSDKRLCADENCKEIISMGVGVINYRAGEEGMVSFKINSKIRIKSKSAGKDPSLWGVEVNGREGYAPKKFIRETKIEIKDHNLKFIVDVVPNNKTPILSTSEKLAEQDNTIEATTTEPLNFNDMESSDNLSNEKNTPETSPVATVLSEIVDGTKVPLDIYTDSKETENTKNVSEEDRSDQKTENIQMHTNISDFNANSEEKFNKGDTTNQTKNISNLSKNIFIKEDIMVTSAYPEQDFENKRAVNQKHSKEEENQLNTETSKETASTEEKSIIEEPVINAADITARDQKIKENQDIKENEVDRNNTEIKDLNNSLYNITEHNNSNNEINTELERSNSKDDKISESDNSYNKEANIEENNENPLKYLKTDKETVVNNKSSLHIEKKSFPFNKQENFKNPFIIETATCPYLDRSVETTSDYLQQTEDTNLNIFSKTTENIVKTTIEVELNTKENKQDSIEIDEHKITQNDSVESNKINSNANNTKDEVVANSENNFGNVQQESTTEVATEVPTQQSKVGKEMEVDSINSFPTESLLYYKENLNKNLINTEFVTNEKEKTFSNSILETEEVIINKNNVKPEKAHNQEEIVADNLNPTTYSPIDETSLDAPLQTQNDFTYQEITAPKVPLYDNDGQQNSQENLDSYEKGTTESYKSEPIISSESISQPYRMEDEQHKTLQVSTPASLNSFEPKENQGLFATIMGTVNNMLTTNKKNQKNDLELNKILFPPKNKDINTIQKLNEENSFQYCKNIGPNGECPESVENNQYSSAHVHSFSKSLFGSDLTLDTFLKSLASKMLEISELLAFLAISAAASLFFIFGYYCFCNSSREGALLLKLNQLESSLLASHKENSILKYNLMSTRQKLASIEDNSFGSNDMVASLKKELEEELVEKARLQEQITVLQKELENAADAGIELNKIVSELLSNQTGDESIISSVEELQKQLNEQQNTIYEINASLAEKSRENSELQLLIAEQNARYEAELTNVQRDNDELEHEKSNLLTRLEEMKTDFDKDITAALEGKNLEIKRLQNEILDLSSKLENEHIKWQTSVAKIEALEECLKNVRKDPSVNINKVIDVAYVKAQLIETQKLSRSLKEKLETELDSRKLAENQLEVLTAEVEKLRQDFNQSEKDKLEAQTRLEVLSNYFKDKENQLQKELSLKEAMWLKQQGETTTTVDRVTAMQEEIQSLKSQNDSLRAEIEAQVAAHKAQTGTLENRAHETWLAARQSDRRYEEARAEATALRRKLTALAGSNVNEANKPSVVSTTLGDELTQAPSPIHMESPGSPILGRMPPPPFLPPPFMGPPPPFMGMPPPPPFVPPGEMRPAPLGRIMSPPPQRSGRFSPQHLDYEDYLDYESNNTWHRHTYSPPPRTYRSLSPTDSRYNYGTERDLISTYDTETDFSPPPSPRESRRRVANSSERIDAKISFGNTKKFNTSNKGPLSSGSEKSFNTPSHNDIKTKKGHASGGGKNLV